MSASCSCASFTAMDESSFYLSLQQLKLQLDRMNQRTTSLLGQKNALNSIRLDHLTPPPSTFPDITDKDLLLDPPNGPVFWQLFRSLRTDVRGLDARVEGLESRLDALSDRLDHFNSPQFTPPDSPGSSVHGNSIRNQSYYVPPTIPHTPHAAKPPVDVSDVGYFDPHLLSHLSEIPHSSQHLYTSDALTFVAKVRRVSASKSLPSIEQFLRGPALRWYNIGLRQDGTHWYDINGQLDVNAFCHSLLMLFGPRTDVPLSVYEQNKTETNTLVDRYAFNALEWARYQSVPASELVARVHAAVKDHVRFDQIPFPDVYKTWSFEGHHVADFLASLRLVNHGIRDASPDANEDDFSMQSSTIRESQTEQVSAQPEVIQLSAEDLSSTTNAGSESSLESPSISRERYTQQGASSDGKHLRWDARPAKSSFQTQTTDEHSYPIAIDAERAWLREQERLPLRTWNEGRNGEASGRRFLNSSIWPSQRRFVDVCQKESAAWMPRPELELPFASRTCFEDLGSRRGDTHYGSRLGQPRSVDVMRSRWGQEHYNRDVDPSPKSLNGDCGYTARPLQAYAESVSSDTY